MTTSEKIDKIISNINAGLLIKISIRDKELRIVGSAGTVYIFAKGQSAPLALTKEHFINYVNTDDLKLW